MTVKICISQWKHSLSQWWWVVVTLDTPPEPVLMCGCDSGHAPWVSADVWLWQWTRLMSQTSRCQKTTYRRIWRSCWTESKVARLVLLLFLLLKFSSTPCPQRRNWQYFARNFDKFTKLLIIFGTNHPDNPCDWKIVKCPINTCMTLRNDDVLWRH